ncbi:MAG TPA: hypothetical protein VIZ28_18475 [Chitinophagaceae bacterium]
MANYLLLRNNKESGPYSLDGLMQLGLKPYDLVWIQGKSAAWRYPSEVEELKPFAPIVEEQPFDRFFKKQEIKPQVSKQEVQAVAPEHEKYIPKRSVFVTMPGQKTNTIKPAIKEETFVSPTPVPVQQTISVTENPIAAQVKYSQPLDEIKEMYVRTLQDRKQKIARKSFWLQSLKRAAVILALVAVGVIAGLIIKSNGTNKQEIVKEDKALQADQAPGVPATETELPDANKLQQESVVVPSVEDVNEPSGSPDEEVGAKPPATIAKEKQEKPVAPNGKKETALSLSQTNVSGNAISPGVETDPATGERNRKVRTESNNGSNNSNTEKTSLHTGELAGLVSVVSNEYKKVAFGGIRNLELTVTNDSKYILDNVIVELQYLKPSEEPLKTESIEFRSVGPKATSTIRIPDTNRGIKVAYRIINIRSRQMDEIAAGN